MQKLGILVGVATSYLVAGCYQPDVRDCTVQCAAPTDCTGGQTCRNGWCLMPDAKDCSKREQDSGLSTIDGAVTPPPDGPNLCALGCTNGTCVDGVCVIDCGTPLSCQNDVTCPANLPCRIICGQGSCKKLFCGLATSCEVQCVGDDSCNDEIFCNANRCSVTCSGPSSCEKRTRCSNACACDVTCSGVGSCPEPSECPASSCKLGNGCTSLLAGCNSC